MSPKFLDFERLEAFLVILLQVDFQMYFCYYLPSIRTLVYMVPVLA